MLKTFKHTHTKNNNNNNKKQITKNKVVEQAHTLPWNLVSGLSGALKKQTELRPLLAVVVVVEVKVKWRGKDKLLWLWVLRSNGRLCWEWKREEEEGDDEHRREATATETIVLCKLDSLECHTHTRILNGNTATLFRRAQQGIRGWSSFVERESKRKNEK